MKIQLCFEFLWEILLNEVKILIRVHLWLIGNSPHAQLSWKINRFIPNRLVDHHRLVDYRS